MGFAHAPPKHAQAPCANRRSMLDVLHAPQLCCLALALGLPEACWAERRNQPVRARRQGAPAGSRQPL